jgi:hypothetical protein
MKLSDEIRNIKLAFDVGDSRRDSIENLAKRVEQRQETASAVDTIVMRAGYLGVIGNQKVFVVAEDEDKAVNELYKVSGDEEFDLLDLGRIPIIVSA